MENRVKKFDQKIEEERQKLIDSLSKNRLIFSNGRKIIFDEVMQAHGHFSAEELVKKCRENNRKVSRATVYRTLHEMLEAGIVRETAFGDKHQHYEHLYDEKKHHHAQCVRCHRFIEFPDLDEDRCYQPLLENQGFKIIGHEMHFYGICRKCQGESIKT